MRLFAIFLDDYHIDKRPEITLPLRDALTKFINQLGPNDLVGADGAADDAVRLEVHAIEVGAARRASAPSKAAAAKRFP